jgi:hypothetical protein
MFYFFVLGSVHVVELRNDVERDTTTARSKCSAPIRRVVIDHQSLSELQVTRAQALSPTFTPMSPQNILPVAGLTSIGGSGLLIGLFHY